MNTVPACVIDAAKRSGLTGSSLQWALQEYKSKGPLTGIGDLQDPAHRWATLFEYYGPRAAKLAELHYAALLDVALFPRKVPWRTRVRRAMICLRGKRA